MKNDRKAASSIIAMGCSGVKEILSKYSPAELWSASKNRNIDLVHMTFPYDAIPKYHYSKKVIRDYSGHIMPVLKEFHLCGCRFKVKIIPALIRRKTGNGSYLPGLKEELIETVLRRWFSQGRGIVDNKSPGVCFTLYELRRELMRLNHTYSFQQLKTGLEVLGGTSLIIKSKSRSFAKSGILKSVTWNAGNQNKGPESRFPCLCFFHPEVYGTVLSREPAGISYSSLMACKSGFSRWLLKWICLVPYTGTGGDPWDCSYTLQFSDIVPLQILNSVRFRDNLTSAQRSMDELVAMKLIRGNYQVKKIRKGRIITDAVFSFKADARLEMIRKTFETERKKLNYLALLNPSGGTSYAESSEGPAFHDRPFLSDPKIRKLMQENKRLKEALKEKI